MPPEEPVKAFCQEAAFDALEFAHNLLYKWEGSLHHDRHAVHQAPRSDRKETLRMNRGLEALEKKVLGAGECIACGACSSLCPYLRSYRGRVVKLHDCDLSDGRCFAFCPRTEVDLDALHRLVFGLPYEAADLGPVRRVWMARARDPFWREKAQTGGVVSALMEAALRNGMIRAGLLTRRDRDLLPRGQIVRDREGIAACAGSGYVSGPTLESLSLGPWGDGEEIGVVGLPCQVLALCRMRASTLERRPPVDRVKLVIGLFCTWALEHAPFDAFLRERLGNSPIRALDITPPPDRYLHVLTEEKFHRLPLDEIRPFIRSGCRVCLDMTGEFSDLSVGTVEGEEGWNTVLVRTDRGEELLEGAERAGAIEKRAYPEEKLDHLREASLLKKARGLQAIRQRGGLKKSYLAPSPQLLREMESVGAEAVE
jgi:coenzyme F420 hydrogenase subunit beta